MNKKCRGFACIINVFQVQGAEPRDGTEKDCERLTELFRQLYFDVKAYNDVDGLHAAVSYLVNNNVLRLCFCFVLS